MFPAISAKPPRRPSPGDVHLRPLLWVLPGSVCFTVGHKMDLI